MGEIIFRNEHFNLQKTLECGQCFRWNEGKNGEYIGVAGKSPAIITQIGNRIIIKSPNADEDFWRKYLDLDRDYTKIKAALSRDPVLNRAISSSFGIHILCQDLWETVVSFIISANNNIPRIKRIIESLCAIAGDRIELDGREFYTFPTHAQVANSDITPIKAGFRTKYIKRLADQVVEGSVVLNRTTTKVDLLSISGVGEKIASCVMLFSQGDMSSFPIDVWIKRIMESEYNLEESTAAEYAAQHFGEYAGIAQQYLYNHYRNES